MALVCFAVIVAFFYLAALGYFVAGTAFVFRYLSRRRQGKTEFSMLQVGLVLFVAGGFCAGIATELMQCIPGW